MTSEARFVRPLARDRMVLHDLERSSLLYWFDEFPIAPSLEDSTATRSAWTPRGVRSVSSDVHSPNLEDDMAKTARKNRKRNARRRHRELKAAMRGEGSCQPSRNPIAESLRHFKGGVHVDNGDGGNRKREANRRACRTRVSGYEE
jgi:hypothetical protein